MSELLAIGVSHKTAPVEVRERVALPDARGAEFVRDLRGTSEVQEAVAISTCNRTELYVVVGDPVDAESTVLAMLARHAGIGGESRRLLATRPALLGHGLHPRCRPGLEAVVGLGLRGFDVDGWIPGPDTDVLGEFSCPR